MYLTDSNSAGDDSADRPMMLISFGIGVAAQKALARAGLVIVPRIPTPRMLQEAKEAALAENAGEVWREMVSQGEILS